MTSFYSIKHLLKSLNGLPHSGCVLIDLGGEVVDLTTKASRLLELQQGAVKNQRWAVIFPESRLGEVLEETKPLVERHRISSSELLEMEYLPLKEDGEIIAVLLLLRKIKSQKDTSTKNNFKEVDFSPFSSIIGKSKAITAMIQLGARVATGDATVLLLGESGTGKELFARAIHQAGSRRSGPFVQLNCAAIPENLLESELFGYEEGAFTGALKGGKPGKFELANGGTIFLDEIGDMPLAMQAKVLRVLQQKSLERVGGTEENRVDVRVVAATNRNLKEMLSQAQFRLDLYYRLAVIKLQIPPLRERGHDIILLAEYILKKLNLKYGLHLEGLDQKVAKMMLYYSWPGNIRELENVLEFACNMVEKGERQIMVQHLPGDFSSGGDNLKSPLSLEMNLAAAEKTALMKALELSGGNKQEAARILDIHRSGLYQKLKKYDLDL